MGIFITIFILAVVAAIIMAVHNSGQKDEVSNKIKAQSGFTASQTFIGVDGMGGIAIDEGKELLCLVSRLGAVVNSRMVPYADVVSVELTEDGSSITKTSRGSQLGGALVGGVLLGGVGVVVGGLSGSKKTSQKIKRVDLRVVIDDTKSPLHNVCFQNVEGARGGIIHNAAISQARHWNGLFDVVIRRADQARVQDVSVVEQKTDAKPAGSVADEIKKLADLKADGILTDDEFQTQKQRLLSRV